MNRVARAAIHEAGHVIVANALGVPTIRATVDDDGSGLCGLSLPADTDAVLNWDLAITLAGALAAAKAADEDWHDLDLRAVLDREGEDRTQRCDHAGFAYCKATCYAPTTERTGRRPPAARSAGSTTNYRWPRSSPLTS